MLHHECKRTIRDNRLTDKTRKTSGREQVDAILRIARLHYEEGMSRRAIAGKVGLSEAHVGRLLKQAMTKGLVSIKVNAGLSLNYLRQQLIETFGLSDAAVCRHNDDYTVQKSALGQMANEIFVRHEAPGSSVAIGGGGSVASFIEAIEEKPREIRVSPMAILGRGPEIEFVDASYLALRLLYKSRPLASARICHLPPMPVEFESRAQFIQLVEEGIPEIAAVLKASENADMSFVGIGGPEPLGELSTQNRSLVIESASTNRKVMGGINYNYFDRQGNQTAHYFQTIPIAGLRRMSSSRNQIVTLVGGGSHKIEAIHIALATKMINSIATDENTAGLLLQMGALK